MCELPLFISDRESDDWREEFIEAGIAVRRTELVQRRAHCNVLEYRHLSQQMAAVLTVIQRKAASLLPPAE